ncbi:hypothetical protein JOC28_001636 [Streptococcus loxodontisalivarius]|uniref:Uncharacterized protein n=1 Tax=Streptococcus loxodontisalivarius TaxID=1349415 RepID=A0ABS2PTH9_9STRE|nr:hypothetical protein [Streptococcus loxodontisalivarius]
MKKKSFRMIIVYKVSLKYFLSSERILDKTALMLSRQKTSSTSTPDLPLITIGNIRYFFLNDIAYIKIVRMKHC